MPAGQLRDKVSQIFITRTPYWYFYIRARDRSDKYFRTRQGRRETHHSSSPATFHRSGRRLVAVRHRARVDAADVCIYIGIQCILRLGGARVGRALSGYRSGQAARPSQTATVVEEGDAAAASRARLRMQFRINCGERVGQFAQILPLVEHDGHVLIPPRRLHVPALAQEPPYRLRQKNRTAAQTSPTIS